MANLALHNLSRREKRVRAREASLEKGKSEGSEFSKREAVCNKGVR